MNQEQFKDLFPNAYAKLSDHYKENNVEFYIKYDQIFCKPLMSKESVLGKWTRLYNTKLNYWEVID